MYAPDTGGCREGLIFYGANVNLGAESTLAFLLSLPAAALAQSDLGVSIKTTPAVAEVGQFLTFEVTVEMVESLGADKYVHFGVEGAGAQSAQLAELAADSSIGENEFVARVSAESAAAVGQQLELALDTTKLTLFDADSGVNLSIPPIE